MNAPRSPSPLTASDAEGSPASGRTAPSRPPAPKIIYQPVPGTGPDDWFADEDRNETPPDAPAPGENRALEAFASESDVDTAEAPRATPPPRPAAVQVRRPVPADPGTPPESVSRPPTGPAAPASPRTALRARKAPAAPTSTVRPRRPGPTDSPAVDRTRPVADDIRPEPAWTDESAGVDVDVVYDAAPAVPPASGAGRRLTLAATGLVVAAALAGLVVIRDGGAGAALGRLKSIPGTSRAPTAGEARTTRSAAAPARPPSAPVPAPSDAAAPAPPLPAPSSRGPASSQAAERVRGGARGSGAPAAAERPLVPAPTAGASPSSSEATIGRRPAAVATERTVSGAPPPAIDVVPPAPLAVPSAAILPPALPAPLREVEPSRPAPSAPPAAPAARPAAATATAPRDLTTVDRAAVRNVLARYEAAYTQLDAEAAAAVYPELDRRALARAFEALQAQRVQFRDCAIDVRAGAARASCTGTSSYRPKVGSGGEHQRRWEFALSQKAGRWEIDAVDVR